MNYLILFLFSFVAASGCSSGKRGEDAVAKVNGHYITMGAFENKLNRISRLPGRDFSTGEKKRELLNELINEELLVQEGLKHHVIEQSEFLRQAIAREYLRQKISKEAYEPSEKEIADYFEQKKNDLEQVRASHILIKPTKPGDPASEEAALKKAKDVLAKIRKEGDKADFAKYAKLHSEDGANKDRGGDLGFFDRKRMVPEFSNVAFELPKVGDVSDVVKTQFGYHIIKLTGEQRGLELFKSRIKAWINQDKQKGKADQLFTDMRKGASIKIYDDVLAKSGQTPPPSASPPAPHP